MKKIVLVLLCILTAVSLSAYSPIKDLIPGADSTTYDFIISGEIVKANTTDGNIATIAPDTKLVEEKLDYINSMEKGFGTAMGCLLPYPEGWTEKSSDERKLKLYNTLLKISTQSGITYISHRAGDKEKTLFKECYMLASTDKKDRIDDPVVNRVPLYKEYYSYQEDTSFGGNIYLLSYTSINDEIFLDIKNNNDLKFMGISLVKKSKVNMSLDFIETEEGIYVFALASVKDKPAKVNVLFYTVDLELSFYNRIVALSNWFKAQLYN